MGSFFVVQVRTGLELEVKEMLKSVLDRCNNTDVKAIYAMETYTEVVGNGVEIPAIESGVCDQDVTSYLNIKFMQSCISNLRSSLKALKEKFYDGQDILELQKKYQEEIRMLTKNVKEYKVGTKKISSLLKGYILIETVDKFQSLPNRLWHLIKSVPNVVGFPSKYNVPTEEIEMFFEKVDLSPRIEFEFDELLKTAEEIENVQNTLLHQSNQATDMQKEKELLKQLDEVDYSLENELVGLSYNIKNSEYTYEQKDTLMSVLAAIRLSVQNKREKVIMPLTLFYKVFRQNSKQKIFSCTRRTFIEKLRNFMHIDVNKIQVVNT